MFRFEITGRQIKAARALAGITQQQLADAANLHVNSVRYVERQETITRFNHSVNSVREALRLFGVEISLTSPSGVHVIETLQDC